MKRWTIHKRACLGVIFLMIAFAIGLPAFLWGEDAQFRIETASPRKLTLIVGKSTILKSQTQIKRVSLASPEIADVMVLSPQTISLTGKAPGVTNLTLWEKADQISALIDIEVTPDVSRLKEMLGQILPGEKDIKVSATHDSIILSGTVSDPSSLSKALSVAEPFAPKKVVNLLKVESSQDIVELIKGSKVQEVKFERSE